MAKSMQLDIPSYVCNIVRSLLMDINMFLAERQQKTMLFWNCINIYIWEVYVHEREFMSPLGRI
jgi:hypothetical protein